MTYRFPIFDGDRVALAPHLDLWAQGIRFGVVVQQSVNEENERMYCVQYNGRTSVWLTGEDLLGAVNTIPGKGTMPGLIGSLSEVTVPNEYGFVCEEFDEDGSCIHSEHMMQAGL